MPKTAIPGSKNESVIGIHVKMLNFMFTAWCKANKKNQLYLYNFPLCDKYMGHFLI